MRALLVTQEKLFLTQDHDSGSWLRIMTQDHDSGFWEEILVPRLWLMGLRPNLCDLLCEFMTYWSINWTRHCLTYCSVQSARSCETYLSLLSSRSEIFNFFFNIVSFYINCNRNSLILSIESKILMSCSKTSFEFESESFGSKLGDVQINQNVQV